MKFDALIAVGVCRICLGFEPDPEFGSRNRIYTGFLNFKGISEEVMGRFG